MQPTTTFNECFSKNKPSWDAALTEQCLIFQRYLKPVPCGIPCLNYKVNHQACEASCGCVKPESVTMVSFRGFTVVCRVCQIHRLTSGLLVLALMLQQAAVSGSWHRNSSFAPLTRSGSNTYWGSVHISSVSILKPGRTWPFRKTLPPRTNSQIQTHTHTLDWGDSYFWACSCPIAAFSLQTRKQIQDEVIQIHTLSHRGTQPVDVWNVAHCWTISTPADKESDEWKETKKRKPEEKHNNHKLEM